MSLGALALGALVSLGCTTKEGAEQQKKPVAGSAASALSGKKELAPVKPGSAKPSSTVAPGILGHRYPLGPPLVVVPGRGVGPIRFGATFKTIERHMDAPCDQRTETRCLYVRRAIEFSMKDGTVVGMKAQRRDRSVSDGPKGKDSKFGSFRGEIPPKIMMGLHRHIVLEEFGEPERKEPLSKPGQDGLVDRHFYDGLVLEYDKLDNGNVVLAAIEVLPSKTAPPAGPKAQLEEAAKKLPKAKTQVEAQKAKPKIKIEKPKQ